MKEALLHYVWKTKSFSYSDLYTTEGESCKIENFGIYNENAGPDFLEGKVVIDDTRWAGHIEMHILSSDWIKHSHSEDPAYHNVILHVVWEEDQIIYRSDGSRIPCIEMKFLISDFLIEGYQRFMSRTNRIPCAEEIQKGDHELFYFHLNRMLIERLETKAYPLALELEDNKMDWSQLLFLLIAKSLGLRVNANAMESLARKTPYKLLLKHRDNLHQLEALLFGQAGMLGGDHNDEYPLALKREYNFLSKKYQLNPLTGVQWKLLRMRPVGFPTIRIAQLADLYFLKDNLHQDVLKSESIQDLERLLTAQASTYWDQHYLFDKESDFLSKPIGKDKKHSIIINAIIPFLFAYGHHRSEDRYIQKALDLLNQLAPEKNAIVRLWNKLGVQPDTAYQTQALIHLYKSYCSQGRCLQCPYGNHVLKKISNAVFLESQTKYAS